MKSQLDDLLMDMAEAIRELNKPENTVLTDEEYRAVQEVRVMAGRLSAACGGAIAGQKTAG